jgi:hypothetical protein
MEEVEEMTKVRNHICNEDIVCDKVLNTRCSRNV